MSKPREIHNFIQVMERFLCLPLVVNFQAKMGYTEYIRVMKEVGKHDRNFFFHTLSCPCRVRFISNSGCLTMKTMKTSQGHQTTGFVIILM